MHCRAVPCNPLRAANVVVVVAAATGAGVLPYPGGGGGGHLHEIRIRIFLPENWPLAAPSRLWAVTAEIFINSPRRLEI